MPKTIICRVMLIAASLLVQHGFCAVTLEPVFGDGMVLQRDMPLSVWGKANPGENVSVEFLQSKQNTVADQSGRWSIRLPAQKSAAQPVEMTVTGSNTLIVRDILIGEVWVCAGQSNMEFPLLREETAREALAAAGHPNIRLLNMLAATKYVYSTPFTNQQREQLTPGTFFKGRWTACSPESAKDFSAIGYFFGCEIQTRLNVPVGLINIAVGGSPTEAWIRRAALPHELTRCNWLQNSLLEPWCVERANQNLGKSVTSPSDELGPNHPFKPSFLYEAGVARLMPFSIRGVIWHQGESNSLSLERVKQHEQLFPVLVNDWRKQWGLGDFPFYFCQLSGIGTKGYKSQYWPEFRDSQRCMAAKIPNTGMVVTSDIGNPTDVHPRNKREVGRRLAMWALAKAYGLDLAHSGPMPKSFTAKDGKLVITFDCADCAGHGLKSSDGKSLRGFEVAGRDNVFHAADAEFGTDSIVVSSANVPDPHAVRYAWEPYTTANLINSDALPASTFQLSEEP